MPSPVTRAVQGLDGRVFTVDEILRMQDQGVIADDEHFELMDGEIVPMRPKYFGHERIKSLLGMRLARHCPQGWLVGYEASVALSATTFLEPYLCLYKDDGGSGLLDVGSLSLAIEIAGSSLAHDRGPKARLYAQAQLRELWVIDVASRRTFIHTHGGDRGWREIATREPHELLTSSAIPDFSIRLADL